MCDKQPFVVISIIVIHGNQLGDVMFLNWPQMALATRSNWEAQEIMSKPLLLARGINHALNIAGNLPPRASGQLNKAPAVTQSPWPRAESLPKVEM